MESVIPKEKKQDDVIDIPLLASTARERIGYNTQKPEALSSSSLKLRCVYV